MTLLLVILNVLKADPDYLINNSDRYRPWVIRLAKLKKKYIHD